MSKLRAHLRCGIEFESVLQRNSPYALHITYSSDLCSIKFLRRDDNCHDYYRFISVYLRRQCSLQVPTEWLQKFCLLYTLLHSHFSTCTWHELSLPWSTSVNMSSFSWHIDARLVLRQSRIAVVGWEKLIHATNSSLHASGICDLGMIKPSWGFFLLGSRRRNEVHTCPNLVSCRSQALREPQRMVVGDWTMCSSFIMEKLLV